MPLLPKRVKYRKSQRGKLKGNATNGTTISFGEYGLQILERGWISNIQIEAARVAITRHMKRKGKLWLRMFPDKSITKKPAETRMGKGKGAPEGWVIPIKPGKVLFEIGGVPEVIAKESLRLGAFKLSLKAKLVIRQGM
ncbi:MAG: 50S ribosomal protein L16 [Candidatus Ancaeobacter aquaticus]|nr:50S ribosomal protein L16 [Candidatus Ancaeobacter aquaticus]